MTSAVLSLFSSSSIELSEEKERVKFFALTIGNNSSCHIKSAKINVGTIMKALNKHDT